MSQQHDQKKEEWEEEFDKFVEEHHITTNVAPYHLPDNKVKQFIRSLLSQQRKEIVKEVEENLPLAYSGDNELWIRINILHWIKFINFIQEKVTL